MSAKFSPKLNAAIEDASDSFFPKEPTTFAEACSLLSALALAERANNPDLVRSVTPANFAAVFCLLASDCATSVASANQIRKILAWYYSDTAGIEAALKLCEPHDLQPVLQILSGNSGFNTQRGVIGSGQLSKEVDQNIVNNYKPDLCDVVVKHIERRRDAETNAKCREDWECLLILTQHALVFSKSRVDTASFRPNSLKFC